VAIPWEDIMATSRSADIALININDIIKQSARSCILFKAIESTRLAPKV